MTSGSLSRCPRLAWMSDSDSWASDRLRAEAETLLFDSHRPG